MLAYILQKAFLVKGIDGFAISPDTGVWHEGNMSIFCCKLCYEQKHRNSGFFKIQHGRAPERGKV